MASFPQIKATQLIVGCIRFSNSMMRSRCPIVQYCKCIIFWPLLGLLWLQTTHHQPCQQSVSGKSQQALMRNYCSCAQETCTLWVGRNMSFSLWGGCSCQLTLLLFFHFAIVCNKRLAWHHTRNFSQIRWIYFTCPSEKQLVENACKGESNTKNWQVTGQTLCLFKADQSVYIYCQLHQVPAV